MSVLDGAIDCETVPEWLDRMGEHKCADVQFRPADIPQYGIGYRCSSCGLHFVLRLDKVKRTMGGIPGVAGLVLKDALRTAKGREGIARVLNERAAE